MRFNETFPIKKPPKSDKLAEKKFREEYAINQSENMPGDITERGRNLSTGKVPSDSADKQTFENQEWSEDAERLRRPNTFKTVENITDDEINQAAATEPFMTEEEKLDSKIDADLERERRKAFFRRIKEGKKDGETIKRTNKDFSRLKEAAPRYSEDEIELMTKAYNWINLSKNRRAENEVLDTKGEPLTPAQILELANEYGEYMVEKGKWGKKYFKPEVFRGREQLVSYKKFVDNRVDKYITRADDPGDYYYNLKPKGVIKSKNDQRLTYVFVKLIPGLLPQSLESAKQENSQKSSQPKKFVKPGRKSVAA